MRRLPTSLVLGRRAEVARVEAFLDEVAGGRSQTLLLSGPAGIGKTTLWTAGVELARERGHRVVSAQPTEVERGS